MSDVQPFIINDRRGKGGDHKREELTVTEAPAAMGDKGRWEDVQYVIALMPTNDGRTMVLGRAVGLRADGSPFVADWFLPQTAWAEDLLWQKQARKRLDTYLGCDCGYTAPCAIHKIYFEQWIKADRDRLQMEQAKEPPPAIVALFKAEQAARQSKIIVPGR